LGDGITQLRESHDELHDAGYETQQDGELRAHLVDVLAGHDRHDGRRAQRRVFAAAENRVDEARHERRVQPDLKSTKRTGRIVVGD